MQFGSGFVRRRRPVRSVLAVALFVAVAAVFLYALNDFGKSTMDRQLQSLENAVHRDIIQCYAIEGVYPPNLQYLQDHYGLTWDPETFFVDYEPIGSNLYPDVTIRVR